MKTILVLIIFLFLSTSWGQSSIPHYDVYPPTPAVSYEGAILDFYSVKDPYGEFSNYALFPIVIDGVLWPTSEHYYQAHKYTDPQMIEKVRQAKTPYEASIMGRDPNIPKREDWDTFKDIAMEIAVRAKFEQYIVLKQLLVLTNHAFLYEHTKNDCYWGDCGDRTGKNKLGLLLMSLRSEYQNE